MSVSPATVHVITAIRKCCCLLFVLRYWLIVGVVVTLPGADTWLNDFGASFSFSCPRGHSVSGIFSIYKYYYDDRLYNLTCSPVTDSGHETGCSWSGYTNTIFESVNYKCPENTFIVGADSYLNHIFQNRRFSFKCCEDLTVMMDGCYLTDWQNSFAEPVHFTVPEGKLLHAVYSEGNDNNNDWRFKFEICTLAKYPEQCVQPN